MNKVRIGDIATVFDGPHATPKKIAEGPIYLGLDGITDDGRFNPSGFAHLSEDDYAIWTRRVTPQEDDIVFSYEATLGRYVLIPKDFYGCLGRRLGIVRCDKTKVNPRWLYYFFLSPEWTHFTQSHKVRGSTVDRLSVDDFPGYEIPLPSLAEQNRAVDAIFSIDQKIDLNTRLCTELESIARTLYDYWFVQFDFPDENGRPYRSSGGEMVWCQELRREVPKGWTVVNLGELSKYAERQISGQSITRDLYVGMDNMLSNMRGIELSQYDPPQGNTTQFGREDILLGNIRPYFQKIWLSDMTGACSADVLVISANPNIPPVFLYASLARKEFFDYDTKGSKGTKMPRGDKAHIMNYPIAFDEDTVRRFSSHISEVFDKINHTRRENSQLAHLRDWLLPMLMNGQARVERSIYQ